MAQLIPVMEEDSSLKDREGDIVAGRREEDRDSTRCQVDASWTREGECMGLGFVLLDRDKRAASGHENDDIAGRKSMFF